MVQGALTNPWREGHHSDVCCGALPMILKLMILTNKGISCMLMMMNLTRDGINQLPEIGGSCLQVIQRLFAILLNEGNMKY